MKICTLEKGRNCTCQKNIESSDLVECTSAGENCKYKREIEFMYNLHKIVVDDRGTTGDGSDAKEHTEKVFSGDEQTLKEYLMKIGILHTPFIRDNIPIECVPYFTSQKGYILQKIKV